MLFWKVVFFVLCAAHCIYAQPTNSTDSTENWMKSSAAPFWKTPTFDTESLPELRYMIGVGIDSPLYNFPRLEVRGYAERENTAKSRTVGGTAFVNVSWAKTTEGKGLLPVGFGTSFLVGWGMWFVNFGIGTEVLFAGERDMYIIDARANRTPSWILPVIVDRKLFCRPIEHSQIKVFMRIKSEKSEVPKFSKIWHC